MVYFLRNGLKIRFVPADFRTKGSSTNGVGMIIWYLSENCYIFSWKDMYRGLIDPNTESSEYLPFSETF